MFKDATTDQIDNLLQQNKVTIREESLHICSTQINQAELFEVFKGISDLLTGKSVAVFSGTEIELFIDNKAVLSLVSKGRTNFFKELESMMYRTENSEFSDSLRGFLFSSLLFFSVARTRWFVRAILNQRTIRLTVSPGNKFTGSTIQLTRWVSRGKKVCQSFFPMCPNFQGNPIVGPGYKKPGILSFSSLF